MPEALQDRVAVVFGCATGIGAACADLLARRGGRVVLADIDDERVAAKAAQLTSEGLDVVATRCDVQQEGQIAAALQLAVARFGRLDIVHNNAAATHLVGHDKDVCTTTVDLWDQTL